MVPVARRLNVSGLVHPDLLEPQPAAFLASDDRRSRALGALVHLTLDERYSELSDPQIAQVDERGTSTDVAKIVGLILGSPEFQRQ